MTKREQFSSRQILAYFLIQVFWLAIYSTIPGGPHFIQGLGFVMQVLATTFSLALLFLLVNPAFPITLLTLMIASKFLKNPSRIIRLGKLEAPVSLYSVWLTVLCLAVFFKFLEHVLIHHEHFISATIFALATLGANFSAYWLAGLIPSKRTK